MEVVGIVESSCSRVTRRTKLVLLEWLHWCRRILDSAWDMTLYVALVSMRCWCAVLMRLGCEYFIVLDYFYYYKMLMRRTELSSKVIRGTP